MGLLKSRAGNAGGAGPARTSSGSSPRQWRRVRLSVRYGSSAAGWSARREDQGGHAGVLGAEPQAELIARGFAAVGRARLELADVDLHLGEAVGACGVGFGVLVLFVVDHVALEENDRRAGDGPAGAVAHFAFDDAAGMERHVEVPHAGDEGEQQRNIDETVAQEAGQPHPLVAPVVRPRMNSRCAIRKIARPGISTRTTKAFQDQIAVRITLVAMAGLESGSMMRRMIRHSDRPSRRAASISERGTASKLALKIKMQMIVESSGSAIPR